MSRSARPSIVLVLLFALGGFALAQSKPEPPLSYGIGHVATPEQLAGCDIDVRPDGQGAPLPPAHEPHHHRRRRGLKEKRVESGLSHF